MTRYSGVERVLGASHVICCVVYTKNLVSIDDIVVDDNRTAFGCREVQFIAVIFMSEKA